MMAQLLYNVVLYDDHLSSKYRIPVGSCLFVTPSDEKEILIAIYDHYRFLCHQKMVKIVESENDLESLEKLQKTIKYNTLKEERVCLLF